MFVTITFLKNMINIYSEKSEEMFSSYLKSGIISILKKKPKNYILIEHKTCACNTKNHIAVKELSIFIKNVDNYVKSYENYIIDFESEDELTSIILWLSKSRFLKYDYGMTNKKFTRYMSENFYEVYYKSCGCIEYKLTTYPIYCLEHIVVSSKKIGPTVKSVLT